MKRISTFLPIGVLLACGCQNEVAEMAKGPVDLPRVVAQESPATIELHQTQVLIKGSIPMNVAFSDVNSDSEPDLFIGTYGHEYFPNDPRPVQHLGEAFRFGLVKRADEIEKNQLSVHLNQTIERSANSTLQFGPATWLNEWVSGEYWLPSG